MLPDFGGGTPNTPKGYEERQLIRTEKEETMNVKPRFGQSILMLFTGILLATQCAFAGAGSQKVVFEGNICRRNDGGPYPGKIAVACTHFFEVTSYWSPDMNQWYFMEYALKPLTSEIETDERGYYRTEIFGEVFDREPEWEADPWPGRWIKVEGKRGTTSRTKIEEVDDEWIVDGPNPRTCFDPNRTAWMDDQVWTIHHKMDRTGSCITLSQWGLNHMLESTLPYTYEAEKGSMDEKFDGDDDCYNWLKICRTELEFTIERIAITIRNDEIIAEVEFSDFHSYFHYNADLAWQCIFFDISGDGYFDRDPEELYFKIRFDTTMRNDMLYVTVRDVYSNIACDFFRITMDNFFDGVAEWVCVRYVDDLLEEKIGEIISETCSYIIDVQFVEYLDEDLRIMGNPLNFITGNKTLEAYYDIEFESSLPDTLEPFPPYQGDREYTRDNSFDTSIYLEDTNINEGLRILTAKGLFTVETDGLEGLAPDHRLRFRLTKNPAAFFGDPSFGWDSVLGTEFSLEIIDKNDGSPLVAVEGQLFVALGFDVFCDDEGYLVFVDLVESIFLESACLLFGQNEIPLDEEDINGLLEELVPIINDRIRNEPVLARFVCQNHYLPEPVLIDLTDILVFKGWIGLGFMVARTGKLEPVNMESV